MKSLSQRIAYKLGAFLGSSQDEIAVYAYSTEILLLLLFTMALVAVSAWLLGSIKLTLAFLAVFAPFRCFGGGAHLGSGPRCVFTSTVIIVSLGYLARVPIPSPILIALTVTMIVLGLVAIVKWIPAGTEQHPITDNRIRLIQKINMSVALLLFIIAAVYLIKAGMASYVFAVNLGAMASLALITPLGYRLIGAIDHSFGILAERR